MWTPRVGPWTTRAGRRAAFWVAALACCAVVGVASSHASGRSGSGSESRAARQGGSGHQGLPEKFTAFAVNLGTTVTPGPGPRPGKSAIVQITIDRWSTEGERDRLVAALQKSEQTLLETLQALPTVGSIRTPDTIAWYLHYAHQNIAPDGSRHIFIATDRPIHFWEEYYRTHSVNYPFTLIEMQVDQNGHGQGKLLFASRIIAKPGERRIEIENYATEAVMLEDVRETR
ncbi:MAG TPA: hypothetical protein VN999_19410 [Thermoanaerobaculia bacterium]|nr:hypothetical protein [Thermoanaerobaculia bacterium]